LSAVAGIQAHSIAAWMAALAKRINITGYYQSKGLACAFALVRRRIVYDLGMLFSEINFFRHGLLPSMNMPHDLLV
jgi:hypothetical protein